MGMTFKFGELDAILADVQLIPSAGRSAFAARLKNLHRLGFPQSVEQQGRGRAITYTVGDLALMTIAIEMSQLGLTPERAIGVMDADPYPLLMAIMMGADSALKAPADEFHSPGPPGTKNPLSMYLYFDPAALSAWKSDEGEDGEDWASATFFYGGFAVVKDRLADWTTGPTSRISLINVSYLLWRMAKLTSDRDAFLKEVSEWADSVIRKDDFDLDHWLAGVVGDEWHISKSGYVQKMRRGLPVRKILEDLEVDFELLKLVRRGDPVKGEPDLFIDLPGQRVLSADFALSSVEEKTTQDIRDRVAYLAARPFQTMFSDNTRFTVMYAEYQDLVRAMGEDETIFADAYDQGVLIVSRETLQKLLISAHIVWEEAKKGSDNGDR